MIEVEGLRKVFQRNVGGDALWRKVLGRARTTPLVALDDLHLSVKDGMFYSLLGCNGAGKTTTMKILCTLLLPDGGSASIAGFDVVKQSRQVRESIGVSIRGERSLYWKLTGRQNLEYFANLSGYRGKAARRRIVDVVELIGLASRIDDYVERYSMGMKQRLAIGCALVHRPPVLLLDEPTIGLDPNSARSLRAFIRGDLSQKEGVTVLYTTHYMHEAEELSDRVAILHDGRIIADGTPEEVRQSLSHQHTVQVQVRHLADTALDALRQHPMVEQVTTRLGRDDTTTVQILTRDGSLPVGTFVDLLAASNADLVSVQVLRPSLEDVFVALTGSTISEEGHARKVRDSE